MMVFKCRTKITLNSSEVVENMQIFYVTNFGKLDLRRQIPVLQCHLHKKTVRNTCFFEE